MPTDLHARASQQEDVLGDLAAVVTGRLAAARAELTTRHPDPAGVARADWATEMGAAQHQQVARAALEAVRADEDAVRVKIAKIANPADAGTFEDQLRDLLVEEAELRVELRLADERVAAASTAVEHLAVLASRAEGELRAAAGRTQWGEAHAELGTQLRDALDDPPLDTVVADADDVLNGATFTAADDRLDQLLPAELRARAEERAVEAAALVDAARSHVASLATEAAVLDSAAEPLRAAVEAGATSLSRAEVALSDYVAGAAGHLAWAVAALERIAAHPDHSAAQGDALDVTEHADGVTALAAETDLAGARAAVDVAQRNLDDAILAALAEDPDRDPETVQAVVDARSDLEAAAIQQPLADARAAYDQSAQDAADAWEVEVPPSLWAALDDFVEARRMLEELSSQARRDGLVQALGAAEDQVAPALDAVDEATRARWRIALEEAGRRGALAAAEATVTDRRRHYLQGDGPAGRTPAQL